MKLTYTLEEIDQAASWIRHHAGKATVWIFEGQMGSGKTTLIKAIGETFGVTDAMSSPTFGIVNEYQTGKGQLLYHFDCYRLKNEQEALEIGLLEYFDSGNICLVEWPDRVAGLLPDIYLKININLVDEFTRNLILSVHG